MSERFHVCQALAAMLRDHGEPNEEEVTFIAHSAFELGLSPEENEKVQSTLKDGGDYEAALKGIDSKAMKVYLFRRVVAATLLDEHINEKERAFIDKTAATFGFDGEIVDHFIDWMKEGIRWEKRGAEWMSRL